MALYSRCATNGGAAAPRDSFVYYRGDTLCAVRKGRWKLHLFRDQDEVTELYDLDDDIGEETDLAADNPDVVAELTAFADATREDIGDERLDIDGCNRRPIGRVDNPAPLTQYDPEHPYIIAEYDLTERG